MSLVGLLVALIVLCLAWWVGEKIPAAFGIKDPIATLIQVVIVILAVVFLVGMLGYGPGLRLR